MLGRILEAGTPDDLSRVPDAGGPVGAEVKVHMVAVQQRCGRSVTVLLIDRLLTGRVEDLNRQLLPSGFTIETNGLQRAAPVHGGSDPNAVAENGRR